MKLLQDEAFDNLFRTFNRAAFHLELKDSYYVPEEAGPFELFMEGKPDDFSWHQPWLRLVREASHAGKSITRVRVVTVPHCDYARWGLTVAPLNIEAGEDLRWLPRHLASGIDFPADDYWLFDDNWVVCTLFAASRAARRCPTRRSPNSAARSTNRCGLWRSHTMSTPRCSAVSVVKHGSPG